MSSGLLKTVCGQLGRTAFCVSVLAALLFAAGASAQTATASNSVEEQFATFHAQLNGAADRLLERVRSAHPPSKCSARGKCTGVYGYASREFQCCAVADIIITETGSGTPVA